MVKPKENNSKCSIIDLLVKNKELEVCHNKDIEKIEALIELRDKLADDALKLQALDYKEHFERLNGEAGRINDILSKTVTKEIYERDLREIRDKMESLITDRDKNVLKQQILTVIVPLVLTFCMYMILKSIG